MPSSLLYNRFTSGVIGRMLRRQVSTEIYQNSAKTLENVVPLTTGGFRIRPGLRRLVQVSSYRRMLPFVMSTEDYHLVLIGTGDVRILSFSNAGTPVADQNMFPSPWKSQDAVDGIWFTQDAQRMVMTQIDTAPQVLEKQDLGYSFGPLTLDARSEQYDEDEDGDVTYIDFDYKGLFTQPGQYPAKCSFCTGRLWMVSTKTYPYRMYASRPSKYNNFQDVEYYQVTDDETTVEEYLESISGSGTSVVYYKNGSVTSSENDADEKREITVSVEPTGYRYTTTTIYERGESQGDSEIVWVFKSQSTTAEQYTKPKMKWETDQTASTALVLEPGSDRNDRISWIAMCGDIFVGTMSNEYVMNRDISAIDHSIGRASAYGSDGRVQNAIGNNSIYYVVTGGRQIRALSYSSQDAPYNVLLSGRCEEMFDSGIRRLAWQRVPEPRLYCVLGDGTVAVLVDDGTGQLSAWCHWSTDDGRIIDMAVLDTENGQDVYCLVERGSHMYVERFEDEFLYDGDEPISCDVVMNPVDGGATISRYKSAGVYHVDSLGTEFVIGQEGVELVAPQYGIDEMLTRVNVSNVPGNDFCIEIRNVPGKDFKVLCIATEVEVSK